MELLKDPNTLRRAISLASQTQSSARSTMLVKQAQSARELLGIGAETKPKGLKSALKTGIAALMTAGDDDDDAKPRAVRFDGKQDEPKTARKLQPARGTSALRAVGFTIFSAAGEKLAPTTRSRNYTNSRAEMMEIMVYKIKEAYFPHQVNVTTWDAALDMDVAKCCGLEECGTARNESGLEYRFAIFRGVGEINWTGGIPRGGIPDVSCSGNVSLGNGSSIWFGNTDNAPHYIVSDLNQLMGR
eukprot:g1477.t1